MPKLFLFSIVVITGCFVLVLTLPAFGISLSVIDSYSKIFQSLGLGFGAILGGIAGFKFVDKKEQELQVKIRALRDQYPLNQFKKKFDLIEPLNAKGTIFIRNLETGVLHHVGNRHTYRDMGFFGLPVIELPEDEYLQSKSGETYLTRGEIGE